jgi:YgiT-type zinc finger domain-containing protein
MIPAPDADKPCPLCGGTLVRGPATIPFVVGSMVAVIKGVPAEVCNTCSEPFLDGAATDDVAALLRIARSGGAEVMVMVYRPHNAAA